MTGAEFKQKLNDLGVKQSGFCKLAGLNKSTVNRYCQADKVPEIARLALMAIEHNLNTLQGKQ